MTLVQKSLKNQKGLTLIELLAVVVILGIIAAIAVPAIGNVISNSKDKAYISEALNVISAAKIAQASGLTQPASGTNGVTEDGTNWTINNTALEPYVRVDGAKFIFTGVTLDKTTGVWTINGLAGTGKPDGLTATTEVELAKLVK